MTSATHPDYDALLRTILANPGDDAPRLVLADWLQEHGQTERAEFIRVQCALAQSRVCLTPSAGVTSEAYPSGLPCRESRPRDKKDCLPWCRVCKRHDDLRRRERELLQLHLGSLQHGLPGDPYQHNSDLATVDFWLDKRGGIEYQATFRRGFVASVSLTLDAFMGGPCRRCDGGGQRVGADRPFEYGPDAREALRCPHCHGTGRTEGAARALFAACPIEEVRLTDAKPWECRFRNRTVWCWQEDHLEAFGGREDTPTSRIGVLPLELIRLFRPHPDFAETDAALSRVAQFEVRTCPTPEDADAVLSAACVAYGESLRG